MDELELVELHEDGEHLVLGGAGGARFVLPISEALRAAVRRDRPHMEHLRAEGERRLTPREIQSRLRAGESVEDVAAAAGLALDQVRRFAGPVLAEQEYVVERVRAFQPGHGDGAPTIGELTAQRLGARDVDLAGVEWSAARRAGAPWVVTVAFTVASGGSTARWSYDAASRELHPLDDEARWISQPEPPQEPAAVAVEVFDVDASVSRRQPARRPHEPDATAELLDDLGRRRGVRPRTEPDRSPAGPDGAGQEPFEGFGPLAMLDGDGDRDRDGEARAWGHDHGRHDGPDGPDGRDPHDRGDGGQDSGEHDGRRQRGATVVQLPSVRPAVREPVSPDDGADLPHPAATRFDGERSDRERSDDDRAARTDPPQVPEASASARPAPRDTRKGRSRSRAKVPSWDEIVFGARPEH
jgi:hypothetical protein